MHGAHFQNLIKQMMCDMVTDELIEKLEELKGCKVFIEVDGIYNQLENVYVDKDGDVILE